MFGIDFGTTFTKVAYVDPTGRSEIILNPRGQASTPSAVYWPSAGEPLVGTDALEQGVIEPARLAYHFKLELGSNQPLGKTGRTPTDAAAVVIGYIKLAVERYLGLKVESVVATCPANFRDDSKQALIEAFERHGIRVLRLVPEPTAAAFGYALDKAGPKSLLAVYDFGGGTFDASIVEADGDQLTVRATEGVARLGGNDISRCLIERVLANVQKVCGERPTEAKEPLFFLDLVQRVETAKMSLGTQPEVPIVVAHKGRQIVTKITAADFQGDIAPLIDQSLAAFDKALLAAGVTVADLDRLVLVGGTSRMPLIQKRVAEHTGLVPKLDIDPERAVAYGAAQVCIAELARAGQTASIHGQVIPAPELMVRDVTAHDVGCCVVQQQGRKRQLINSVILKKNTPIPCQHTECFYLEQEDQTGAQIEILQGEANAAREACLLIGELRLENLPRESVRSTRIQVEYALDANGMVRATAADRVSGQTTTVSVDYKRGVKPQPRPDAA